MRVGDLTQCRILLEREWHGKLKRDVTFLFSSSAIGYGKRMVLKGTPDRPAGREDAERLCRDGVLKSPALTSNLRAGPGAHVHTGFLFWHVRAPFCAFLLQTTAALLARER